MTDPGAHGAAPLAGLTVVDFSTFLAGPFCTQMLGDLGADVVKVEPPGGDSSRAVPPHFVSGDSVYYLSVNRNKRSVVVNMKSERGREIALDLIGKADVVVENFGPGVRERLGLNADEICESHPELVWCTISGFGCQGKRSDLPAYDLIVQALSGVMAVTGEEGRPPVRLGIPAGDLVAGLYGCIGILARLSGRRAEGSRRVDIAMFDGLLSMVSYLGAYTMFSGVSPGPQGSAHESIPTYRTFRARDETIVAVTANTERMWRDLCTVLGRDELAVDPRFVTLDDRLANQDALSPILERSFLSRDGEEWVARCKQRKVPAALVSDVSTALDDARKDSRSMVVGLEHSSGRVVEVIGNPVKYGSGPQLAMAYPPQLGEHTSDVLSEMIGLTAQEIRDLNADGAIGFGT